MLHGTKKESILQWYNTLKEGDVTSLAQFTDGSLFYDIITSLNFMYSAKENDAKAEAAPTDSMESMDATVEQINEKTVETGQSVSQSAVSDSPKVGENGNIDSEKKYHSVKKCIDGIHLFLKKIQQKDIFLIDSISLINYSECLIGNELQLAKVAVFLLTALSIDRESMKSLTQLDIQVQEDIKEFLSFVFTDRSQDDGPIKKSEFHKLLTQFAGISHRRQYSQSSGSTDHGEASDGGKKTSKKRKDRASISVYQENQDSPLKTLFESPKFQQEMAMRIKEYENRILRNACYMEEKKVAEKNKEVESLKNDFRKYHEEAEDSECFKLKEVKKQEEEIEWRTNSDSDKPLKKNLNLSIDNNSSTNQQELSKYVVDQRSEDQEKSHSSDESETSVFEVSMEEDTHLSSDGESSNIQEELNNCVNHPVVKSKRKRHLTDESEKSNLVEIPNSKILKIDDGNDMTSSKNAENVPGSSAECSTKLQGSADHIEESNLAVQLRQYVKPTMKVGFLGVGAMGQHIVKILLLSGHQVTVYNRSPEKCNDSIKAGALRGETPADVVKASDIIFSCVSDASAAKSLLVGREGVLKGLEDSNAGDIYKGYVELTSVDPKSAVEIAECITGKGGKYIVASMIGTIEDAEKGTLTIVVSGDETLYQNCLSCFRAMSKHAIFTNCDVGSSSKYRILLNMFLGTTYGALADALSFSQALNVSPNILLDLLKDSEEDFSEMGNAVLDLITNGSTITNNTTLTDNLKCQQKAMTLAIKMSNTLSQPVHLSARVNEMYEDAKRLGAAEEDLLALILGAK
ncbi:putative oxidoreductase GLYR1 homolog [Trichonephila clavata]|uniref:Putative oxidoreductase GLYR1 homolog n=1 Tax=Trichonephila clavata TaxID=2740835 RepID=A0A8X6LX10_TRICU|nr:putative oxidoreductase GLYR1 homolog [Trichonephila clavata]